MTAIVLYPFGHRCPKCCLVSLTEVRWCRACDEMLEVDHLHLTCICTFRWRTKTADSPTAIVADPPPAPPADASPASSNPPEVKP